ncbi:hypothetical protein PAL_GLEAN10004750 [Pteropus alecto]|uniref:Uncharacterized protein n=1 Tax=Pteropus alecto TaxID=9402 RepID=L5KD24_PTEAL|nr:hypothetical protein PAL_GLEAN10004750 [Pteropus alecto]
MDCEFQEQAGWGCTRAQHVAQTVKEMAQPAQLSMVLNLKQPIHPTQPGSVDPSVLKTSPSLARSLQGRHPPLDNTD